MFSEITRDRLRRFRQIKRAYFSLWILGIAFVLSLFSEFLANDHPLYIYYNGKHYFPVAAFYPGEEFGQNRRTEADYIALRNDARFREQAVMILPIHEHSPNHSYLDLPEPPPTPPSREHPFGTDRQGRDVLARILYGFRICMLFSLSLMIITAILGIIVGGVQGYIGGKADITMQRIIEIWSALPFLYVILLIGAVYGRSFGMLLAVMALFSWIGLSYYMRGEFLRLKNQTYVRVAQAQGLGAVRIFRREILPNALTPLITILPFSLIGGITALTALDFLGFGLQPPTPSWGELLQQGLAVIRESPWLTIFTTAALFITLMLATFIGEGVRDAFDPRSRVRME
ncbi:MAG: ABC transporter permease subunit [Leptospiraceae bacterium]|nr:ABC transporter permease subunit [Leptospiraceae bacterium]